MNFNRRYNKASSRIHRRNRVRKYLFTFLYLSIPILFILGTVFLLRAPFMQIKEVIILNNKDVSGEELSSFIQERINQYKYFFIPKTNFFFYGKKELENDILSSFYKIENVEINLKYQGLLSVNIKEREAEYVWCSIEDACFLMDVKGLIFAEADELNSHDKIIFKGKIEGNPLMQYLYKEEVMRNYKMAVDILLNESLGRIHRIEFESTNKTIFVTSIGDIYLNAEENMITQMQNVILLVKELRNRNAEIQFDYIDGRFGNKMYYKVKN